MATYVAVHAHPDDEAIATGGTMLIASQAGHRVVLVLATRGECGEVDDSLLDLGESLGQRRESEAVSAARVLGVHRVEFLGYRDSGMMGDKTNNDPDCFWQADVEQAAERLAAILSEEQADVVSVYDSHGGYGHPDHIQVHRVGHRAAQIAGVGRVYESTINRDHINALRDQMDDISDPLEAEEMETIGSTEDVITTTVDVTSVVAAKREAMAIHASQIGEESFFLALPEEVFTVAFGQEWFIRTDCTPGSAESWILDEPHPVV